MQRNLNDKFVTSAGPAPPGKRLEYWDRQVPGFGLRVGPATRRWPRGRKTFVVYLRLPGAKTAVRHSIAEVDANNLTKDYDTQRARDIALEWRRMKRMGQNPLAARREAIAAAEQKSSATFGRAANEWFAHIRGKQRKATEVIKDVEREFVSLWKDRPIASIAELEVRAVLAAKAKVHPAQARNLLGYIKRFFRWAAIPYGLNDRLPTDRLRGVDIAGKKRRRDRMINHDELRAIWLAAGELRYPYADILRLLILTGQRRSDVADARWSEFDLDKREWVIPKERMKMYKDHVVPLTATMIAIIDALPRGDGPHLFSADGGTTSVNGHSKAKERIELLLQERGMPPWVVHDLRRAMRTNLSRPELGIPENVRELMIGHVPGMLIQTYDLFDYLEDKRRGFERWEAYLRDVILASPDDKVVRLKSAAR